MALVKLALVGDLHLSERSPRHAHVLEVLDQVVDELVTVQKEWNCPMATAFLGDLVEGAPSPTEIRAILQRLQQLATLGPVAIVLGNHEHPAAFCWFEEVLPKITVAWDDMRIWRDGLPATIVLVPYPRLGRPPFDHLERDPQSPSLPAAHTIPGGQALAAERIARSIATARRLYRDRPLLVLGHFTIEGMTTRDAEFELHRAMEVVVPRSAFDGVTFGAVGHIHRAQDMYPNLIGIGSLIRHSFTEAEDPKSYVLVTLDDGAVTWTRRPVAARSLVELALTWPLNAVDQARLADLECRAARAEVKIVLTIPEDQTRTFDPAVFAALQAKAAWSKIERRIQPAQRQRAPGLTRTASLAEQLTTWASATGQTMEPDRAVRLAAKVTELEAA